MFYSTENLNREGVSKNGVWNEKPSQDSTGQKLMGGRKKGVRPYHVRDPGDDGSCAQNTQSAKKLRQRKRPPNSSLKTT